MNDINESSENANAELVLLSTESNPTLRLSEGEVAELVCFPPGGGWGGGIAVVVGGGEFWYFQRLRIEKIHFDPLVVPGPAQLTLRGDSSGGSAARAFCVFKLYTLRGSNSRIECELSDETIAFEGSE